MRRDTFLAGGVLFLILTACFPHTLWFMRLWCASVLGYWYGISRNPGDGSHEHRGIIPIVSIFVIVILIPDLCRQEMMRFWFRSLLPGTITSIEIVSPIGSGIRTEVSPRSRHQMANLFKETELYHTGFDGTRSNFKLVIMSEKYGESRFDARVSENHPDDVCIRFRAFLTMQEVIIPDARDCLDEMVLAR